MPECTSPAQSELNAETVRGNGRSMSLRHRIIRGSTVYAFANLGMKGLNFALNIVYTRFLVPADYGIVSLAEVLASLFIVAFSMGLSSAIQPLYFGYLRHPVILRRCVSTLLLFGIAISISGVALTLCCGAIFGSTAGLKLAFFPYVATAVITASALQLVDYRLVLYQAEERPFSYLLLVIFCFLLTVAATLYYVVGLHKGALGLLNGKLIGAALSLLFATFLCRWWLRGGWDKSFIREAVSLGFPLVPHLLLAMGLVAADRLILQKYRSMEEVGLYSLAYTLGMTMFLVTSSISQAWSPVFYQLATEGSFARIGGILGEIVFLMSAIGIFGSMISELFVRAVLDPRYWRMGRLVPWIIGGYLFHALFTMFQLSALHARRTQMLWVVSLVAFAANIGLNFAWDPVYGMYGAAYATTLAYALEALLMYAYAEKVYALPVKRWRLFLPLVIFVGVLVVTQLHLGARSQSCATLIAGAFCLATLWRLRHGDLVLLRLLSPRS